MTWDFFHETTRTFMSFVTSHCWEKNIVTDDHPPQRLSELR